ncbi:deoxyribodipyrimidine photo-lyase [Vibrio sinensis]|uniref:Deoxyribodipyrimidine photo-lyase n=1 Tax=Vibrio sinensis TaxID=2302434 RepID=A0A3A6QSP9_9VIBR|nr:deoxyribodipyrimidine photo-lyase [Vibrio sinensis]RJX73676.1 deoxyribodipyrimidine photo-lyase [Vibrio sinensis]
MSALLWLRRDFRVHDNPALFEAIKAGANKAVFISTPKQWREHHLAPIQADLIYRHLKLIKHQLLDFGMELIHLKAQDYEDQVESLKYYCHQHGCSTVYANSEPELNEINRDKRLIDSGFHLKLFHADTITPVGSLLNKQGDMFKVFTPFRKRWLSYVQQFGIECYPSPTIQNQIIACQNANNDVDLQDEKWRFEYPQTDSTHWPLSDYVMSQVVPDFLNAKIGVYKLYRDIPSVKGTSGLSPYLAIGAISPRWLATKLIQNNPHVIYDMEHPDFTWLNELIWRDFYKHLLFHYPNLAKGDCFQTRYKNLPWPNNPEHFKAWCEGKTGYPIVDAAMRQLIQTGWMHNRLRMIVASFLTKHLMIDWRWGERFFMSHLIDGDFSANNGGWQWAASTGCDAQPYFRIFNPITQSKKFDPNGNFLRKYLPELNDIPDKDIHFPHDYLELNPKCASYWPPVVEHKHARLRALDFYK